MDSPHPFHQTFGVLPIFGMIHLAGDQPVRRALEELALFAEEGVDGAIIENYHGSPSAVVQTLRSLQRRKPHLALGINILPNEFDLAFLLAHSYEARFIQLDHVAGRYAAGELDVQRYLPHRQRYRSTLVFGGVWPKYYHPLPESDLKRDLREGTQRADAIVVTGTGTGKETPLEKIQKFRETLGDYPLVLGAGLTPDNAYEQLSLVDGAIAGTSLKIGNNTLNPVDRQRVRDLMAVVREVRKKREGFAPST